MSNNNVANAAGPGRKKERLSSRKLFQPVLVPSFSFCRPPPEYTAVKEKHDILRIADLFFFSLSLSSSPSIPLARMEFSALQFVILKRRTTIHMKKCNDIKRISNRGKYRKDDDKKFFFVSV